MDEITAKQHDLQAARADFAGTVDRLLIASPSGRRAIIEERLFAQAEIAALQDEINTLKARRRADELEAAQSTYDELAAAARAADLANKEKHRELYDVKNELRIHHNRRSGDRDEYMRLRKLEAQLSVECEETAAAARAAGTLAERAERLLDEQFS